MEIRRPSRRFGLVLAVAAALLAASPFASASSANDPLLPWAGGAAVETPLEHLAGDIASALVGRRVLVSCNGEDDWRRLAALRRFDPATVWGFVAFTFDASSGAYVPGDAMQLSEAACWYLDQYRLAPPDEKGKLCRVSTHVSVEEQQKTVKVTKRVKVKGTWRRRVVWVTKTTQVPIEVPTYGACPGYMNRVFALQTISHESQHLMGIRDEATAECNGMQRLAWVAQRFGARPDEALQMAGDYYRDVYEAERAGTPYYLATCPDPSRP